MAQPYLPKSREAQFLQQLKAELMPDIDKSFNPQVLLLSSTLKQAVKILDASEDARKKLAQVFGYIKEHWTCPCAQVTRKGDE